MYAGTEIKRETTHTRKSESGNISQITTEVLSPIDLRNKKYENLISDIEEVVNQTLVTAQVYLPGKTDFYNTVREEIRNWSIHGIVKLELKDPTTGGYAVVDFRPVKPKMNENGYKTLPISEPTRLNRVWSGARVTIDTTALPIFETSDRRINDVVKDTASKIRSILDTYTKWDTVQTK